VTATTAAGALAVSAGEVPIGTAVVANGMAIAAGRA